MKPKFCPLCGAAVEVVRYVFADTYEMLCEACKVPCVIMVNDFVVTGLAAPPPPKWG